MAHCLVVGNGRETLASYVEALSVLAAEGTDFSLGAIRWEG
jgi:hypothetical protein